MWGRVKEMHCAALPEYLLENFTENPSGQRRMCVHCVISSLSLALLSALTHWPLNSSLPIFSLQKYHKSSRGSQHLRCQCLFTAFIFPCMRYCELTVKCKVWIFQQNEAGESKKWLQTDPELLFNSI